MYNGTAHSAEDDHLAGGLLVGISLWGLVGYIPCLIAILTNEEMRSLAFYRMVVSLGAVDCMALVVWFLTGIFLINHGGGFLLTQTVINNCMNFLIYVWFNIPLHLILIAFTRYLGVVSPTRLTKYFKSTKKIACWLLVIHLIALVMALPTWIKPGGSFSPTAYLYAFGSEAIANFYFYFEIVLSSSVVSILAVLYLLILKGLWKNSTRIGDSQSSQQQKVKKLLQVRMIVQVIIVSALYYAFIFTYYCSPYIVSSVWGFFVCGTVMWVFNHGANAWVYLAFNPKIREQLRKLVH